MKCAPRYSKPAPNDHLQRWPQPDYAFLSKAPLAKCAAPIKPGGVARKVALTDTALPIARSSVAFISSG